ncbi:hypothetical protein JVU11DRAFT_1224 [Chiua virens]|nr:hypothetical protein JVU11DRAFT_1224 [Chiua virens]
MRPTATKSDLPSPQDIRISIHNAFVNFLEQLTTNIQSPYAGKVSTTMDLWSTDHTKAAFFWITAHWIQVKEPSKS